jgi:hypothetical protein
MKSANSFIASLLLASTAVGISATADSSRQLLFTQEINQRLGVLEIYDNQEPADAVYQFSKQHGLDDIQRQELLDNTCLSVSCSRKQALLWSIPIDFGSKVEQFYLYEGVEAADAVHGFVTQHNLSEEFRNALMEQACSIVECTRTEPGKLSLVVVADYFLLHCNYIVTLFCHFESNTQKSSLGKQSTLTETMHTSIF